MITLLGFFSYIQFKRGKKLKSIMLCLYYVLFIETVQLVLLGRLTDINDIILNFLKGYIGILFAIKINVIYLNNSKSSKIDT